MEVAAGTYPSQEIRAVAGRVGPNVVFRPASGARVVLGGLKFGANSDPALGPDFVTVRGMEMTYKSSEPGAGNQQGIFVGPGSTFITLEHMDAGNVHTWFADHVTIKGGDYGPCHAVWGSPNICGNSKLDVSTNVTIDGARFHDYRFDETCFTVSGDGCQSRWTFAYNVWSTAWRTGSCSPTDRILGDSFPYVNGGGTQISITISARRARSTTSSQRRSDVRPPTSTGRRVGATVAATQEPTSASGLALTAGSVCGLGWGSSACPPEPSALEPPLKLSRAAQIRDDQVEDRQRAECLRDRRLDAVRLQPRAIGADRSSPPATRAHRLDEGNPRAQLDGILRRRQ